MCGTFTHPTSGSDRDRPQRLAPSTPSDVPPSAPSPCITASHPRLGAGNAVAAGLANLPPTSALDLSHHARPAQARPCRAIRTGSPVSGDTDRVAVCPPDEGPVRSAPKIICDTRKCAPGPFKPRLSVGAIRDPRSHAQHGAATVAVPIGSKFATPIPSGAIRARWDQREGEGERREAQRAGEGERSEAQRAREGERGGGGRNSRPRSHRARSALRPLRAPVGRGLIFTSAPPPTARVPANPARGPLMGRYGVA